MAFVRRKLDEVPDTLGQKLRSLRRTQAISLPVLVEKTRIQTRYLEALEQGRYADLPEPVYTRNFLRAYARALGADESYLLELYAAEVGQLDLLAPHRLPRLRVRKSRFFVFSRVTAVVMLLLPALAIAGYFLWQTSSLLRPPEVVILTPGDGALVQAALLPIVGYVTDNDVTVVVNGTVVAIDESLHFETEVDLARGLNVVTVQATRRYSREALFYRRVVFNPLPQATSQGISSVSFMND